MYLENNNKKVHRIFFKFLQKNQGKFFKNLEKLQKIQKLFQKIQKNVLENLVNFYKFKISETSTVELF